MKTHFCSWPNSFEVWQASWQQDFLIENAKEVLRCRARRTNTLIIDAVQKEQRKGPEKYYLTVFNNLTVRTYWKLKDKRHGRRLKWISLKTIGTKWIIKPNLFYLTTKIWNLLMFNFLPSHVSKDNMRV